MSELDSLAKKYAQLEVRANPSQSKKLDNIYKISQDDTFTLQDPSRQISTSRKNNSILNLFESDQRSKSPSNIGWNDQEESPFKQRGHKINTFEEQVKLKAAIQNRQSPFRRINFPNNDAGQHKFEQYRSAERLSHTSPTFKSSVNLNHEEPRDAANFELTAKKRNLSPFKPEDKINFIFQQVKQQDWMKNAEQTKPNQSNFSMMQSAAAKNHQLNIDNRKNSHGL